MAQIHNLGFPRIGEKRELKFALENYWNGECSGEELQLVGRELRAVNWQRQAKLDWLPVGDFSFYDQVLDTSFLLGNLPKRLNDRTATLDNYFRVARGRSVHDTEQQAVYAGEMTKWFDTNYHYIVPEVDEATEFQLNAERLLSQLQEAQAQGVNVKPVVIGPVTYLWLSKSKDQSQPLALLEKLLVAYQQLLSQLADAGAQWVQIDEPILVTELAPDWQQALRRAYQSLAGGQAKLLLTSYFGNLAENLSLTCSLPVDGIHIDCSQDREQLAQVVERLGEQQILSVGVMSGRNIWKADLNGLLDWLEPYAKQLGDRLWLAPSCSLLHVPVDLESEVELDPEIRSWLAFAQQKLEELSLLKQGLNQGRAAIKAQLEANQQAIDSRRSSARVHNPAVKTALAQITPEQGERISPYCERAIKQAKWLKLPAYPTTTIGSFPQTRQIRQARQSFKRQTLSEPEYRAIMRAEIQNAVREQEALDLDVIVHGEAERNDMVEYFGEQLEGYVFSKFGWVQSYGSRCVKPPILFGDIYRPKAMTLEWSLYAQSLTEKPMKGMLTGPVTLLNWSFVRDDQPREQTCKQLALAVRSEVQDLEAAGIRVIQIDEAALREGLPLRRSQWQGYLDWAVESFRLAANGVEDETQIHTHMCYSEFNDIIQGIADMDADVITIETSRSDMELLDVFDEFDYPNEIGPGVYDIHSPNIPEPAQMMNLMRSAAKRIPAERLWVNPDCGLKTRQWHEVIPALANMVAAAKQLRETH